MINVNDLKNLLSLKLLAGEKGLPKKVMDCYIGDLLSWVMAKAKSGDIWLTVMGNINAIAVASLKDMAVIILCEDSHLDKDAKDKADEEGITVLQSDKNSFQLACIIKELIQ